MSSESLKQVLKDLFDQKLKDKENWKKLENYAACYITDTWGKSLGDQDHIEYCLSQLYVTLPREDFISYHRLYELRIREFGSLVAKKLLVEFNAKEALKVMDEMMVEAKAGGSDGL